MKLLKSPITREELTQLAEHTFGDLVKAVVDVKKGLMVIDGELHADEEALLLDMGSNQQDLWGINLYPEKSGEEMVEFDSMINIRPFQHNRSLSVESEALRKQIFNVVEKWVT